MKKVDRWRFHKQNGVIHKLTNKNADICKHNGDLHNQNESFTNKRQTLTNKNVGIHK